MTISMDAPAEVYPQCPQPGKHVAWWWLWWWAGCGWDAGHPTVPSDAVTTTYTLRLRGEVVGVEHRHRSVGGDREVRERTTRWQVGGQVQERHHHVELVRGPEGWRRRLDGGDPSAPGRPVDGCDPGAAGEGPVWDPMGAAVEEGRLVKVEGAWLVEGHPGLGQVECGGDGRPARHRWGPLVLALEGDPPSTWVPVDLDRLTRRPVEGADGVAEPRRLRRTVWTVDGVLREVTTPLRAELPLGGARVPLPAGAGRVGDLAREAAGRPLWPTVESLVRTIPRRLAFAPVLGPLDAEGVLAGGAGDCTEHVVVFLAASERLGLVAREVAGGLLRDGALVPHSWAEVRVGERWVPVDPTLGQAPADAGRLPLASDAAAGAARLVEVGTVRLDVAR